VQFEDADAVTSGRAGDGAMRRLFGRARERGDWARALRIGAASLAIVLGLAQSAVAEDSSGRFAVKGAGTLPCKVFTAEREKKSNGYFLIGGWLEGYLSAHNRYVDDTFDITSFESTELLLAVIGDHCVKHPEDRLYPVVNAMVTKLAEDRLRTSSERVRVVDGPRATVLYEATLRRIQEALAARKLYEGEADGTFSETTKSALAAFQKEIQVEATGFPDQATLWRLLRK
jgi:hypothetical protein